MEAKSVAEITEEGNFELNVGNLTAVLHNPKCQDLAIVSMAGAYRTGKSFMLNFFIRYLRNRGWENESWFGDEDMKIQDGFEWSNGSKPHTLGILVCPEIFYVEKNGKQVGVMIVDTQGLFDASSSPDTNVNIMSISTLLSSHQILNFKNNVRGTDFEHLQLSLKYALAASRSFPRKQKSFQKLTFLVRDWQHPNEYTFGQGGDGYIDGILNEMNQSQPENVSQVKKSIRSGFEHVNGFLMPRPNEKIDGAKDFQKLQNSDITGEFRKHIIMLVDSVLNPKNLVVKKMFGQPISANGLMNLISEFSKYIQSGKQPKIETLLESAIKANNATALQEAVSKYRCHLKQLVGSSFPSHIELGKHHEKALKEADKVFRSMATLGSENQTQNVLIQVKEECKSIYERKTEEIRFIMVANIQEFRLKAEKIEKKYEDNMSKLPMDISFETLGVKHKEYYSQALCEFKLGTDSFKGILPKDEIYIKKKLMTRMEEFFKQLKQQRETLENMKRFAKEKEKLEIQNVARDCLDIFHLKMIQISGEFIPRIEEACQKEMRSILGKYGRNCERFTDQYEVRKCQNKLKDNLEEHCERAVKNNERNMEMLKSKCAEHSQTAAREYDKKMKNLMGQNQLHEEEFLDAKHSEFKDSAMYRFDDLLQSMSHSLSVSFEDEFKMKLDMAMNEKYQVYKKKNDRERMIQKMKKESKECAHHAKTALSVYTHGMDQLLENGKSCSEMRLLQKHENCEFTALREFKNLTANVTCSQGNFRENLMKEIEEKLFQYRQINRKNHDEEKQKHINALTDEYEASMKEWTERFCPEDDVMKMKYSMMSVDVLEKFSRLMNSKETAEDKEELKKGINGVYLKIEAENKKARDEREFLERQKELDMKILKVNSEIRRNDFIRSIKSYENIYHEDFENIFSNVMLEVLEEFDEETKDLGDSLDKKILEARIDLEKTIQGVLNRGIQENNENRERVDDAVQAYVLKYREVLGELMLNAYVDTSGFKEIEKHHIEEVDAQDGNDAIKELIKKEIRKRTEKAKLQNERNKEYRPVIANEDTVAKYLAIGWITITSPIWIPLGLVGVVLGGVVGGIVAGVMTFKDFIKKKMNAKK